MRLYVIRMISLQSTIFAQVDVLSAVDFFEWKKLIFNRFVSAHPFLLNVAEVLVKNFILSSQLCILFL